MQKQKLKEVLQTVSITFRFFHSRSEPSHLLHYEETLDFLKKTTQSRSNSTAPLLLLPGGNCLIGTSHSLQRKITSPDL